MIDLRPDLQEHGAAHSLTYPPTREVWWGARSVGFLVRRPNLGITEAWCRWSCEPLATGDEEAVLAALASHIERRHPR